MMAKQTLNIADKTTLDAVYNEIKNNVADKPTLDVVYNAVKDGVTATAVKSVQSGVATVTDTSTMTMNITISAVNLQKAVVVMNGIGHYAETTNVTGSTSSNWDISAYLSNSTTLVLHSTRYNMNKIKIPWQVVEFY